MKQKHRILPVLLALTLFVGLTMPAQASSLYFTAINDSVAPLTASTMPFWSGGSLYVPYTVFDANTNGIGVSLNLYTSYNRKAGTVSIFSLKQMLVFDLDNGTCQDDVSGTVYTSRSVLRGGVPYLSLSMVCSFFGLEYSYNQLPSIPQGYLVRIKSADAVLDDGLFIERARDLVNNRLREYTQSLSQAESTDPEVAPPPVVVAPPVTTNPIPEVSGTDVPTYIAFRCGSGESLGAILDVLDASRCCGVLFLTPQVLEEEGGYVRRALGSGHSIGILAEGDDIPAQLAWGSRALEEAAQVRTTLAYVPAGQRPAAEQAGWVCWRETLLLAPGAAAGASSFASSVVERLGKRRSVVYLTLEGDANTARVLSVLLRQLSSSGFNLAIPLETRL